MTAEQQTQEQRWALEVWDPGATWSKILQPKGHVTDGSGLHRCDLAVWPKRAWCLFLASAEQAVLTHLVPPFLSQPGLLAWSRRGFTWWEQGSPASGAQKGVEVPDAWLSWASLISYRSSGPIMPCS